MLNKFRMDKYRVGRLVKIRKLFLINYFCLGVNEILFYFFKFFFCNVCRRVFNFIYILLTIKDNFISPAYLLSLLELFMLMQYIHVPHCICIVHVNAVYPFIYMYLCASVHIPL